LSNNWLKQKITLYLEKNGETRTEIIKLASPSSITRLNKIIKEQWTLTDVTGENQIAVNFIRHQIDKFNLDQKGYKIPIRETVRTGAQVTGVGLKGIKEGAKKVIKSKLLRRDK